MCLNVTMASKLMIYSWSCLLLLVILQPTRIYGDCNTCSTLGRGCVSNNQYKECVDNEVSGDVITCPNAQLCDLSGNCRANLVDLELGCGSCQKCNDAGTFACTSTTSFALCLGSSDLSAIVGTCTIGTYCNKDNPNICSAEPPTCSFSTDPVPATTPSPLTDPQDYCKAIGTPGRYPVGRDLTTTCRQYIRCIQKDATTWISAIYNCPGTTYFDSAKKVCTSTPPNDCSGTVRFISASNIRIA